MSLDLPKQVLEEQRSERCLETLGPQRPAFRWWSVEYIKSSGSERACQAEGEEREYKSFAFPELVRGAFWEGLHWLAASLVLTHSYGSSMYALARVVPCPSTCSFIIFSRVSSFIMSFSELWYLLHIARPFGYAFLGAKATLSRRYFG